MGFKYGKGICSWFRDFNGHVGKWTEGFEGVHGGNGVGKRNLEEDCLSFVIKRIVCPKYMVQKKEKKKITFSPGGNETEIDFVLVGKNNRKYVRDVKVIPGKLQHRMVVADVDKRKMKKIIKKKGP